MTSLGGGPDALAAAIGMVVAEKNTNPFVGGNVQNVCGDASLPVTPELRGITPLIDPDVDVDGAAAQLSAQSAENPLNARGLSVFDLMEQAGLGTLVVSQNANGGGAQGNRGQNTDKGGNSGTNDEQTNQEAGNPSQGTQPDNNQDAAGTSPSTPYPYPFNRPS